MANVDFFLLAHWGNAADLRRVFRACWRNNPLKVVISGKSGAEDWESRARELRCVKAKEAHSKSAGAMNRNYSQMDLKLNNFLLAQRGSNRNQCEAEEFKM